jgi:hypothetical protein
LNQYAIQHPDISVKARLETAKLHGGDPENQRLWNNSFRLFGRFKAFMIVEY